MTEKQTGNGWARLGDPTRRARAPGSVGNSAGGGAGDSAGPGARQPQAAATRLGAPRPTLLGCLFGLGCLCSDTVTHVLCDTGSRQLRMPGLHPCLRWHLRSIGPHCFVLKNSGLFQLSSSSLIVEKKLNIKIQARCRQTRTSRRQNFRFFTNLQTLHRFLQSVAPWQYIWRLAPRAPRRLGQP